MKVWLSQLKKLALRINKSWKSIERKFLCPLHSHPSHWREMSFQPTSSTPNEEWVSFNFIFTPEWWMYAIYYGYGYSLFQFYIMWYNLIFIYTITFRLILFNLFQTNTALRRRLWTRETPSYIGESVNDEAVSSYYFFLIFFYFIFFNSKTNKKKTNRKKNLESYCSTC